MADADARRAAIATDLSTAAAGASAPRRPPRRPSSRRTSDDRRAARGRDRQVVLDQAGVVRQPARKHRRRPSTDARTARPAPTPAGRPGQRVDDADLASCEPVHRDDGPELLHRQVPDPAVPAADLPGRRHRVRRPLGGPRRDQRDRDRLRPQPQRLHRRRARLDAVHARDLGDVRRRRQRRRRKDPYNPVDAIFAAARYLKAAGAERGPAPRDLRLQPRRLVRRRVLLRAQLIGGLPADLVGSLTGLTQGRFPVAATATYAGAARAPTARKRAAGAQRRDRRRRRSSTAAASTIYARRLAGRRRPGRRSSASATPSASAVRARCATPTATRYTYAHLGKVAATLPGAAQAPRRRGADPPTSSASTASDPKPTRAATPDAAARRRAGRRASRRAAGATSARPRAATAPPGALFAHPGAPATPARRRRASSSLDGRRLASATSGSLLHDVVSRPRPAAHDVIAARRSVASARALDRAGTDRSAASAHASRAPTPPRPHLLFEIRPAGKRRPAHRPEADPRRLEAARVHRDLPRRRQEPAARRHRTPSPSIGQILLMSKEQLAAATCSTTRDIEIYGCGRQRHPRRRDRPPRARHARVPRRHGPEADGHLAALRPRLLHRVAATSPSTPPATRSTSRRSTASRSSATRARARSPTRPSAQLLTLQGTMKPHQIITLMQYDGTDNTFAMADHYDHIHVGFHPRRRRRSQRAEPAQWDRRSEPPRPDPEPDRPDPSPARYLRQGASAQAGTARRHRG